MQLRAVHLHPGAFARIAEAAKRPVSTHTEGKLPELKRDASFMFAFKAVAA